MADMIKIGIYAVIAYIAIVYLLPSLGGMLGGGGGSIGGGLESTAGGGTSGASPTYNIQQVGDVYNTTTTSYTYGGGETGRGYPQYSSPPSREKFSGLIGNPPTPSVIQRAPAGSVTISETAKRASRGETRGSGGGTGSTSSYRGLPSAEQFSRSVGNPPKPTISGIGQESSGGGKNASNGGRFGGGGSGARGSKGGSGGGAR